MAYTIQINDEQRTALRDLIAASDADRSDAPLEFWVAMLDDLPKVESENPGTLHGFCL